LLAELLGRGLRPPLLVISDGSPGLIGAAETVFRAALRQRCVIHRCRDIVAKVPKAAQAEVKAESGRSSTSTPNQAMPRSPWPVASPSPACHLPLPQMETRSVCATSIV
jgi:hypothetical protein